MASKKRKTFKLIVTVETDNEEQLTSMIEQKITRLRKTWGVVEVTLEGK